MPDLADRFSGLVDLRVTLTPVGNGQEPSGDGGSSVATTSAGIDARTVGVAETALRAESADPRVLGLDGRSVTAEFHQPDRLFRLVAQVDIMIRDSMPYVLAIRPMTGPEEVQRRNWVRVHTVVPLAIRLPGGGAGTPTKAVTETIDLSAGGARIMPVAGLDPGMHVAVSVSIDTGDEELEADVLEATESAARLRFTDVSEGASTRITKHVFDAMMASRRAARQ